MPHVVFFTGRPGIGKTTAVLRVVEKLREAGLRVGGMVSREMRVGGKRVGFEIIDLSTGRRGTLAHVNQPQGPRVGKYRVCLEDLDEVGVGSIRRAIDEADVVVIDEVGPMELFSQRFKEVVREAVGCGKHVVGTIHQRVSDKLVVELKKSPRVRVVELTEFNRDHVPQEVAEAIIASWSKKEP